MKSSAHTYGGKVMNGKRCRFWPFGDVENKGLLAAQSLSGRLGGVGALPRALIPVYYAGIENNIERVQPAYEKATDSG